MTPLHLQAWARKWSVGPEAMHDLAVTMGALYAASAPVVPDAPPTATEAWAQSAVRLEAPHKGVWLGRNNVGAMQDNTGRVVRFGLANDSKQLNAAVKSGDLIGWRRVVVTPAHVGCVIAQFVSRECKRPGWTYGGDAHEQAQLRWAHLVLADGGDAGFATGPGTL
jgi:hypothetical protein